MRSVNLGSADGSVRPRLLSMTVFFSGTVCLMPIVVEAQQPTPVTVFEGARLIVGDGSAAIEDSAFIVQNGHFTTVGRKGQLKVPAGAARVDLTGKTVMPAIIDAHKHLAVTRDVLWINCSISLTTASAPR